METFYHHYKNKKVKFFSINIRDNSDEVKDYAKEFGLNFPILLDSNGKVSGNYGIKSHPTYYFIGPNGEIRGKLIGSQNWMSQESINYLDYLLKTYN